MDGDGSRRNQSLKSILPLSFNLHKRLLDVELDSVHKEIEELAVQLGHAKTKSTESEQIRERLKQLFAHEEELHVQLDHLSVEQNDHAKATGEAQQNLKSENLELENSR